MEDNNLKRFGEYIRLLRESEGLSQEELAKKSGFAGRAAISALEKGKNENAKRMVPIGSIARDILDKTIERNDLYNLRTKWIFCSPDGSVGNQSTMRNHWQILKKERQLPGTVYSLRHTFISMMKNVMPEQMIKDIVGHSVSMTTFETYGHLVDGEERRAAEIIDLAYGQNFGQIESTTDGL